LLKPCRIRHDGERCDLWSLRAIREPERLQSMLDREFALLVDRLNEKRGATTRFFVFADTVVARSYTRKDDAHGWLGVEFQTAPRGPASQIIIHVRLLDTENVQEQETLGIVGVNLVHGALYE
jgi:hypothetical protein